MAETKVAVMEVKKENVVMDGQIVPAEGNKITGKENPVDGEINNIQNKQETQGKDENKDTPTDGELVNGEDKDAPKIPTTLMYKVKVSGLPRYYSLGEFKKLVKEKLGLALNYVRCFKRGNPWLHLTFSTPEDQMKALKALNKYTWRKKTLSCNIVTNDAVKRKSEDSGDDSDAKKAKLDMSVEERVLISAIPYHNIPYDEQLKKKKEELRAVIKSLGDFIVRRNADLAGWAEQQREKHDGLIFHLEEMRPSPVVDGYRNKCEFRVGLNPDTQERTVGCRLENYKDGTIGAGPADSLKHLPEKMKEAIKLFQDFVRQSDKEPFSVEQRQGYWRHLMVRVSTSGETMLVIVIHPQNLSEEELTKIKDDIKSYFIDREGTTCNVTSLFFQKCSEFQSSPTLELLYGKPYLEERMLDLTFQLSPSSYFQVNTKGGEVLYSAVIELIEPTEDTTVLDLCCGTGGIGLCIAKKCKEVFGIDFLALNIEDAKRNAELNGITNCEFFTGKIEDILPTIEPKITGKRVIPILYPPRTGLTDQKLIAHIRKMDNVERLVYVCFNHKAPIRNFLDLCCPAGKNGITGNPFVPIKAIPVDVVPHTIHGQMVILLERVDPSKLPKAKNPPARTHKTLRGRGRGMKGFQPGSAFRGTRGRPVRGRGIPRPFQPMTPIRMGFGRPLEPPMRPPVRNRIRDEFVNDFRPAPIPEREFLPPLLPFSGRHPRLDFSSDELALNRYSDFRRDVEDAIDSFPSRSLHMRRSGTFRLEDPAVVMLEREEMAYRAGLTHGLVGARVFGPPPNMFPSMNSGRFKGSGSGRGGTRGGKISRDSRGRRGKTLRR